MDALYDAVIVGGGPAGLTAALYLSRAKYRVLVLEKEQFGGQIAITEDVVNYPGVKKTSGKALAQTMLEQAKAFGAEMRLEEVVRFSLSEDIKTLYTRQGAYRCLGVLLAMGAAPRSVGFLGEETYKGRGVAYCATCDGEFFTGKDIFVVGGGYAAAEESIFLTQFARHVTILVRKDDFSCAASVADKAKNHEKITVLTNTVLEEVAGEDGLNYARYRNTRTGDVTEYRAKNGENFGVFVLAGYAPDTQLVADVVTLDAQGCLVTDSGGKTNLAGVYGAGDICAKPLRQVVTATGDGALAATQLEKYLAKMCETLGVKATPAPAENTQDMQGFSSQEEDTLHALFAKMKEPLLLRLTLDDRPASAELKSLLTRLATMTDKLTVEAGTSADAPCVQICRADGTPTGLAFHGVPNGHEFSSFLLGLCNASGAGQTLDDRISEKIRNIDRRIDMQILVTLSCSMCPETVVSAQRIAAENENVTAEVYDAMLFPALRDRYRVMSVPCLVINGEKVVFGKKNIEQILGYL